MSSRLGTVGVLMGGPSTERAISLKSGEAVVQALTSRGHRAVPIALHPTETTAERVAARLAQARCDVAFLALHGSFGEDGAIQEILEQLEMPYTGSGPAASRLAFDKWRSHQQLTAHGVAMPPAIHLSRRDAELFQRGLQQLHRHTWPLTIVVKPVHQGSSMGVALASSAGVLAAAVTMALQLDDELLLETHVRGRELTVAIFDEQALPVIEIRTREAFFTFHAKYQADSTEYLVPAPLDEATAVRVQQAALTAHHALGCRHFSRVDLILTDDGTPTVLEVNTIPGLTERSLLPRAAQAVGCAFPELCEHMVALAIERVAAGAWSPRGTATSNAFTETRT